MSECQNAMCDQTTQNVRAVVEHTLTFYGVNFPGWSGLARRTCLQYGLPDPLQYLQHPWRADRWRAHCKRIVQDYWDNKLLQIVESSPPLKYVDTAYASTRIPMRVWQLAGLCSESVKQATVVNWMMLGVYFTRELLYKMKKAKSPNCLGCGDNESESLNHFLLHCSYYQNIRQTYLPQYILQNKSISEIFQNEDQMILSILDPLSSKLPGNVTKNWLSPNSAYKLSRQFCYNMHRKRDKLYQEEDKLS